MAFEIGIPGLDFQDSHLTEQDEASHDLKSTLSRALSQSADKFRFDPAAGQEFRDKSSVETANEAADLPAADKSAVTEPWREVSQPGPNVRRRLSAESVQALLLESLARIPNFPDRGVAVTVYGFRPWNAMLNFAPRSASHSEAIMFRQALADIVQKLRAKVDVDLDQGN